MVTAYTAVNTLEQMLVLHVSPVSDDDHCKVERLARTILTVMGDQAEIARVDQDYAGERAANAAAGHGIVFTVVKLSKAKSGGMLLPRRRVVERSFASATCFGRLTKIVSATLEHSQDCASLPSPVP